MDYNSYIMEQDYLLSELSPYQTFLYALKSKEVRRQYPSLLSKFLDFIGFEGDIESKCKQLYNFGKQDNDKLRSQLMKYCIILKGRVDNNEISEGTLRNQLKPIKLFFEMNEIILPWTKISKGLPSPRQASDDRCPTLDEIKKLLLNFPDRRLKVIVLIMISSGIRVGAWNWLQWKHVKPINDPETSQLLGAKFEVYAGERDEYFTFISPEAYMALLDYMDFRQLHGEKITGDSWLIRDTWQKIDKQHGHRIGLAKHPKKMDSEGIRRLIYDAWKIQGIIEKNGRENRNHEFKSSHGFRKFFQTHAMQVMHSSNVELLMGHSSSMGLKKNYYKPSENMLLQDYLKAVKLLTINKGLFQNEDEIKELLDKSRENEMAIRNKLFDREQEIQKLREIDKLNSEAIASLSDRITTLEKGKPKLKEKRS